MGTVSATALQAMLAAQTGEVFLTTVKIEHSGLAQTIRLVNDTQNLVRADGTYIAYPFETSLPMDDDKQLPAVRLAIDNVSRDYIDDLRALSSPPTVTLEVVLASSPDTVEAGPYVFTMKEAGYDALRIEAELGWEDVASEPFPGGSFDPLQFPRLF